MMSIQFRRWLEPAIVALLVLTVAHWFDAGVLAEARLRAGRTYDPSNLYNLIPIAHLLTAAGVVALVLAACRSRSLLVGVAYALVGGFLVSLPATFWAFDSVTNDRSAPLAPQPIAGTLGDWFSAVSTGVTGAVYTLAAAMLLSGLALIGFALLARERSDSAAASPAAQANSVR
jgi:hypothetical protein